MPRLSLVIPMVALSLGRAPSLSAQAQWHPSSQKDEMTDETHYVLALSAVNTTAGPLGRPYRPSLIVRCVGGRLEAIYVNAGTVLDDGSVVVRWDSLDAASESWSRSDDYSAVFSTSPDQMLTNLAQHRRLLLRFFPYAGTAQTARFSVPRLTPFNSAIKAQCGRDLVGEARAVTEGQEAIGRMIARVELLASARAPKRIRADSGLYLRPMVKVWRQDGQAARTFQVGAYIEDTVEGITRSAKGDTLRITTPGNYRITITADDVAADTAFDLAVWRE